MDSDSWNESEVNFFRQENFCRRDYWHHLKNKARFRNLAVLELTFRKVSLGKWAENRCGYRRNTMTRQYYERIKRVNVKWKQVDMGLVWLTRHLTTSSKRLLTSPFTTTTHLETLQPLTLRHYNHSSWDTTTTHHETRILVRMAAPRSAHPRLTDRDTHPRLTGQWFIIEELLSRVAFRVSKVLTDK